MIQRYPNRGSCNERGKEAPPHCLAGKVVAYFLQTKENTTNGTTKGNSDPCSATGRKNFPSLTIIVAVLVKHSRKYVADATADVDQGT